MSIIPYLDTNGLTNVWSKIDTNFMRKNGAKEKVLITSGSIASADNNSKNSAKKITISPTSGSISSVNLCFCGKNLLPNPGTKTISGITWQYDSDGFLTVNGKATGQVDYYFIGTSDTQNGYEYFAPPGEYTFHLEKVSGNGSITFYCVASKNTGQTSDGTKVQIDNSGDEAYTLTAGVNCRIMLRVVSGQSVSNLKLKVQVEKGSFYTGYVPPYRESVSVNLNGNSIDSDSKLIISEDNSVKLSKSTGDIDLSGSYDFSKLQIPSFRVFNGVRNSSDITSVEYYSLQLGDDILSNTELVKYLNGIPSSVLGNEPITTSNLNTIIDYILSGGDSTKEYISAVFSIPNQEFDLPSTLNSGKVINLTSVSSNGITVSSSSISVPKKAYIHFSGEIIFTAKNDTAAVDVSIHLYAKISSQYYRLASADFVTGFNNSKTATINSTIELPSDSNTITLVCYGGLSGPNAAAVINGLQSDGNISVSEV